MFTLQEMLAESKVPDKQKCVGQEKISGKWGTGFKMSLYRAFHIFEHALIIFAVSSDV